MSDETCGPSKPHFQCIPEDALIEVGVIEEDGDGSDIEIVESLDMPLRALEIVPPPLEPSSLEPSSLRSLAPPPMESCSLDSLAASLGVSTGDMLTTDDLDAFLSELDEDRVTPLESGIAPRMPTIMPLARCGLDDERELEPALAPPIDDATESPAIVEMSAPPQEDDPYATLVRVLANVAEEAGSSGAFASLTDHLAGDAIASAWRAILRGESDDFAACGPKSLDEWASEALAHFLNAPTKAGALRRELRARGVAAYGLVMEAA